MEQKVEKLLDLLIAGIEKGGEFASAQLPDVAQQILLWGVVEHTFLIVLFALLAILLSYGRKKHLAMPKFTWQHPDYAVPQGFIWAALVGACTLSFFHVFLVLKPLIAPKLYLLDYLRGMKG